MDFKKVALLFFKLALSLALVAYLMGEKQIVWAEIAHHLQQPRFWIVMLLGNMIVNVLTSFRWRNLAMRKESIKVSVGRFYLFSWASQSIGFLFGGLLGTDLARGYLMGKKLKFPLKSLSHVIAMDRIFSLVGLGWAILALSAGLYGGFWLLFALSALVLVNPLKYNFEIALSFFAHGIKVLMIFFALNLTLPESAFYLEEAVRLSLGLLLESLPISWQGLGVGQLAFERLLLSPGGANIYSSYFIGKSVFKLLGLCSLVYLLIRGKTAPSRELKYVEQS